jgi:hypothetical protein
MKGFLTAVAVIAGVVANILVLGGVMMTLAFGGESYRGRESAVTSVLWNASWLLTAASVVFSLWFAWGYFMRGRMALSSWAPLAAAVAAGAVGLGLIYAGEWADGAIKDRALRQEIAGLRAAVEGGRGEKICELVSKDPQATADQMAACRAYVESLSDPRRRWEELNRFVFKDSFAHWNPQQLGLTKDWDWNHGIPVIPKAHQVWFVQTYFDTWLSFPETLTTGEDLVKLHFLGLSLLAQKTDWSPEVRSLFRDQILPLLKRRIESHIAERKDDAQFAKDAAEELEFLARMAEQRADR